MSSRPQRIAIVGGGMAGVTAAWQLARLAEAGANLQATLFEATPRFGGTVETIRRDGFTVETGPDGWISEKPWASELARELGLGEELIGSNDATRVTWILNHGRLQPIPDGMRLMVPTDLAALNRSSLFSPEARAAYAAEPTRAKTLKAAAPAADESIASFVERHFGGEILTKIAAPLLSGVFGGDVNRLSVRAVMPQFVAMERQHGSLILALQHLSAGRNGPTAPSVFTSLRSGTATLIERMLATIPETWLQPSTSVRSIARESTGWTLATSAGQQACDTLILAVPAHTARALLAPLLPETASLLALEASSAILVSFGFSTHLPLPQGFGFLVPSGEESSLLAATFVDQKFAHRTPPGARLLRAFFGGEQLSPEDPRSDAELALEAHTQLAAILGPLPRPDFHIVRRWPRSLPQYTVGHLERMASLAEIIARTANLHLLGNAYRGVGLPDLIRDARSLAHSLAAR